jgi:hypothetical protein
MTRFVMGLPQSPVCSYIERFLLSRNGCLTAPRERGSSSRLQSLKYSRHSRCRFSWGARHWIHEALSRHAGIATPSSLTLVPSSTSIAAASEVFELHRRAPGLHPLPESAPELAGTFPFFPFPILARSEMIACGGRRHDSTGTSGTKCSATGKTTNRNSYLNQSVSTGDASLTRDNSFNAGIEFKPSKAKYIDLEFLTAAAFHCG